MQKKRLKRLLTVTLVFAMLTGGQTVFGRESTLDDLQSDYTVITNRAAEYSIPFTMTYEEYITAYDESGFLTTQEYADAYLGIFEPNESPYSSSSSGSSKWYYNIGTTLPANAEPKYDKYNLYNTVMKGDIIFEANGGFGITGHVAIVEGKYYNAAKNVNYIRIIEAIDVGVVRSCLDDTRVDDKAATLLRVSSAKLDDINTAVDFCIGELGSSYKLDFRKDTSSSETDWYCSELVWAAYYNQGIDIEVAGNGEPGITPRDIRNSSKTTAINFK